MSFQTRKTTKVHKSIFRTQIKILFDASRKLSDPPKDSKQGCKLVRGKKGDKLK